MFFAHLLSAGPQFKLPEVSVKLSPIKLSFRMIANESLETSDADEELQPLIATQPSADPDDVSGSKSLPSYYKWMVAFTIGLGWGCVYCTIWLPSYIEHTIMSKYNYSLTSFSYIMAVCYFGAIFGSLWCSYYWYNYTLSRDHNTHNMKQLIALLLLEMASLLCHCLLLFFFHFYHETWMDHPYYWIIMTRVINGICLGSMDALAPIVISFWFSGKNSADIGMAFGLVTTIWELSIIIPRYVAPYIEKNYGIVSALCFGVLFVGLGIIVTLCVLLFGWYKYGKINHNTNVAINIGIINNNDNNNDNNNNSHNNNNTNINSPTQDISFFGQFKLLKMLYFEEWMAVCLFILFMSFTNVILSILVEPFVVLYNISQSYANQLLSIISWVDAFASPICGKILDTFDCYIEACIFGSICCIIACVSITYQWNIIVSVILLIPLVLGWVSSISILTFTVDRYDSIRDNNNVNINVSPIASGFAMSAAWVVALLVTNGFAWIHDATNSYTGSFFMIVVFCFMALVISTILYIIKYKKSQSNIN